jgi:hypothetical protein
MTQNSTVRLSYLDPIILAPHYAQLRTADSTYTRAWTPYWTAVAKAIAPLQITQGGPVILVQIENEFANGGTEAEYMSSLEASFRSNGVVVPTTHNNKGERGYTYATGAGAVDVWGEPLSLCQQNIVSDWYFRS